MTITHQLLAQAYTYPQYYQLIGQLVAEGKTTGPIQNEQYAHYTLLNFQRMKRLHEHTPLSNEVLATLAGIGQPLTWLAITEAWCGDAAQNLPPLALMAEAQPMITFKLILRDEHPEVMDAYLTAGARSIPKLICLTEVEGKLLELGSWGPRPAPVQAMMLAHKANPVLTKEEFSIELQKWYNADRTVTLQKEMASLLGQWQAAIPVANS